MPDHAPRPALFVDFDNTITRGDVLDAVIERYSATGAWRGWEADWQAGRISTPECLGLQVGDLRASPEDLRRFMAGVEIDPAFAAIVEWARQAAVPLEILSDNFSTLIHAILEHHGLGHVPVLANELVFDRNRPQARFPFRDPACARCAHCKAQHLRAAPGRPRIYVGDGLSDLCPCLVAEVVFAKDSLAAALERQGTPFRPYRALDEVLAYLEANHGAPLEA